MATSTPLIAGRETRCIKCLRQHGCSPWKLPWWETILDSIPGVGMIPSFIGWGCRSAKVEKLDDTLFLQISSLRDDRVNPDDESVSIEDDRFTALEEERTVGDGETAETRKYDLWTQRNVIAARRTNAAALFWINFIGSVVTGACLHAMHQFGRL